MILHRLMLQNFRGVVREEVEVPARGVLVIEGPNESGKTSLMDGLEMLLEHKASSGRGDIKAARPIGRDVPVVVEAEFTIDGRRMRYRKEFIRNKTTSLEFPESTEPALTGDDAHDFVRDLLDRQVDRSLWRALRIAQDEPLSQVAAGTGMDSLRRALDTAAGGEDPTGDDSLMERVAQERERYLTAKRGEPTGDLKKSETRVADARQAVLDARTRHAELDSAVADHESQVSVHEARRESLRAIEIEVARLEAAGRTVAELRQACTDADAELDRAVAAHDATVRELQERADLVDRTGRERRRRDDLRTEVDLAAERLEPARSRAEHARTELELAEVEVARARLRLEHARAAEETKRARADLNSVDKRLHALASVKGELAEKEIALAEVEFPAGTVERLRGAAEKVREAQIRSAVSAPRVEVIGQGLVRIGDETFEADPGWTRDVLEETVFEIGEVALTVSPASDTETVRREERAARSHLNQLLADFGVASLVEAERRERRSESLRAEIDALRRRRSDLLGVDNIEDLTGQRDQLAALLQVEDPEDPEGPEAADAPDAPEAPGASGAVTGAAGLPDAVAEARAVEERLERCRAEDRAASAEADTLRTEHATRLALTEEAEQRVAEAEQCLSSAREGGDDAVLTDAEERARERADGAREKARVARERLDTALADAPPELLTNVRASHAALIAEERESAAAVATALGKVNAIGDQGRLGDVGSAERELESAERENAALWRRARAADLLYQTLEKRRAEALKSYQAPFHRAVTELGSLVHGRDFDVQLGEDLTILARRIGDVTVPYESLSGGAREQLAVIVRIACARLVGDDGVPVFLDDTMGYTDPSRRLTMGAVIAAGAAKSQVIVLTCDRARFAGIGGAHTHVMQRERAIEG